MFGDIPCHHMNDDELSGAERATVDRRCHLRREGWARAKAGEPAAYERGRLSTKGGGGERGARVAGPGRDRRKRPRRLATPRTPRTRAETFRRADRPSQRDDRR